MKVATGQRVQSPLRTPPDFENLFTNLAKFAASFSKIFHNRLDRYSTTYYLQGKKRKINFNFSSIYLSNERFKILYLLINPLYFEFYRLLKFQR